MNSVLLLTCLLSAGPIDSWEWTPITSKTGGFKALFPSIPTETNETIETAIGDINYYQLKAETANGQIAMAISYNDYPKDILDNPVKDLLDSGRDGAIKNLDGKLMAEGDFSYQDNPGREFTIIAGEGESRLFYHTRVFIVDKRMYQLQIVRVGDVPLDVEAVVKFFSSFELTQ